MRKPVSILLALLLVAAAAWADDTRKPGLQPGDDLPGPFRPYNVTGKSGERTIKLLGGKEKEVEGQFHCLVCEHGLAPIAMVFVRNVNPDQPPDGLIKLLKGLNVLIQKHRRERFGSFAVFVNDDLADVVTDDEKRYQMAGTLRAKVDKLAELNLGQSLVLTLESPKYLKHYPLEEKAQVIVVLYKDLKVVRTFNLARLDDEDIKPVLAAIGEMLAVQKKPEGK